MNGFYRNRLGFCHLRDWRVREIVVLLHITVWFLIKGENEFGLLDSRLCEIHHPPPPLTLTHGCERGTLSCTYSIFGGRAAVMVMSV